MKGRRTFFLGVNTGYVDHGLPDHRYVEFYRRRSSPALHCAIVGNVVVPGGYKSNSFTPTLSTDPIWTEVATAIRAGGTKPGIQLATAWRGYTGTRSFVGQQPDLEIDNARLLATEMGQRGSAELLKAFDEAAAIAVGHGYTHLQLHAAHGYLLSLLVDSRINSHAPTVIEGLSEFAARYAQAGIETSIRISLRTGNPAFDAQGSAAFHDAMARIGFDYVDLSSGFYNIDKRLIYPARPEILAIRLDDSLAVAARHPSQAFIYSGRAARSIEVTLPENLHLGLCRDLIANPDFLSDLGNGCRNHSKCHYFSRGEDHITCARWTVS